MTRQCDQLEENTIQFWILSARICSLRLIVELQNMEDHLVDIGLRLLVRPSALLLTSILLAALIGRHPS